MSVNRYKDGQLTLIAGSGDSNTFTGTKTEVEQAIAAGKIKENWTVYITDDLEDIVNTPGGSNCDCKVEYITQEAYDLLPEDKLTNDIEYRITDNNPATPSAKNMAYDNSKSNIEAVNVQDAIDAVNESFGNIKNHMYLSAGRTCNITFENYAATALIFVCIANKPLLIVYSNGYLCNVCENTNCTVTLSNDYKTITIKNNTIADNGIIGVLQSTNINFTMDIIV